MKNIDTKSQKFCRNLKAKNYFGLTGNAESVMFDGDSANIFSWCIKSTGAAGPDNQPVSPVLCKAERACYEPPAE